MRLESNKDGKQREQHRRKYPTRKRQQKVVKRQREKTSKTATKSNAMTGKQRETAMRKKVTRKITTIKQVMKRMMRTAKSKKK